MNFFLIWIALAVGQIPSRDSHFVEIRGHRFHVSLAQTPEEWSRGLMFRERLGENEGMLFVGDREKPQVFWMKNTSISLDIIFISKDWRIVDIKENTLPFSERAIPSKKPAMHVLEIKAGRAKNLHFKEGDKVQWQKP